MVKCWVRRSVCDNHAETRINTFDLKEKKVSDFTLSVTAVKRIVTQDDQAMHNIRILYLLPQSALAKDRSW